MQREREREREREFVCVWEREYHTIEESIFAVIARFHSLPFYLSFSSNGHKENKKYEVKETVDQTRRTVFSRLCRRFALAEAARVSIVRRRLNTKYPANGTRGWSWTLLSRDVYLRKMIGGDDPGWRLVLAIKRFYRDELVRRFGSSDFSWSLVVSGFMDGWWNFYGKVWIV